MDKYVISGGASFIGVALIEQLISRGHFVYLVCRDSSKNIANIPIGENIKILYYGGLKDISSINNSIQSADVFIHLAWSGTGHDGRNNADIQKENVAYSMEALEVAKRLGCKLFVDAGSQAEYGYVQDVITEETSCHPENEYGKAKLKFGELASARSKELGFKFIHLRIFSIYGETDHPWTLVMSAVRKMLNNEELKLSSCEQFWNFLYIKDCAKQICLLCSHALDTPDFVTEIYNIASDDTRKLKDFVEEMHQLTNSKSKLIYGSYNPENTVSLSPSVEKTKGATGGFLSDYSFGQVIEYIINNYKTGFYD